MSNQEAQTTPRDDQEPTLYHRGLPGPFLVVGKSLRLVGAIDDQGTFGSLALQTRYGIPSHDQKVSFCDPEDGFEQVVRIEGGEEALKMVLLAYEALARFCCDVLSPPFMRYEVIVEDERDQGA